VGAVLLNILTITCCWKKRLCNGFSTSAISWIHSYLSNRTQRIFLNGSFSNVKHVKSDVPQGTSLGPLVFSIFTKERQVIKLSWSKHVDSMVVKMGRGLSVI
jgi:hypothetical protein